MSHPTNARETTGSVATSDATRWFIEEVRPHESALRSFLKGSFPTVRDVDDIVQESYIRMWRARAVQPIESARAFLFGIARRCAVDVIRRERRAAESAQVDGVGIGDVVDESVDAADALCAQQEIELLAEALHSLPARCREVMVLRKIDRLSQQEIATRLGITVATVEAQIFRGMEKCARYLRSRGLVVPTRGKQP